MIDIDEVLPGFTLSDHFGRRISSRQFGNRRHLMFLFYPLDWTPT